MDALQLSWWLPEPHYGLDQYGPESQPCPAMGQTINTDQFVWDTWLEDPAVDHVSSRHVMDNVLGVPGPPPKKPRIQLSPLKPTVWNWLTDDSSWPTTEASPSPPPSWPAPPEASPSPQPSWPTPPEASPSPAWSSQGEVVQEMASAVGPITVRFVAPVTAAPHPRGGVRSAKKFGCDVCGKRFGNRYHLKVHMYAHTGERPFVCDVCGMGFRRGPTLNAHRRTHDQPQYSCPTCHRTFNRPSERLVHLLMRVCVRRDRRLRRTTTGWFCDVCDKAEASSEGHECKARRERRCPVCGEDFKGARDHKLVAHARQFHRDYVKQLG